MVDEEFRRALTIPLTGRSWVEDLPNVGITHLYIAGNQITIDGVASLLATAQFHVLDVGTVETNTSVNHGTGLHTPEQHVNHSAGKLIPILGRVAKNKLTYFRAHHSICTSAAPYEKSHPLDDFLPELPAENKMERLSELDTASTEIHELPADTNPVFELPGSTPLPLPQNKTDNHDDTRALPIPNRGSVYAPEALSEANDIRSEGLDFNTSQSCYAYSSSPIPLCTSPVSFEDSRTRKIQELLAKRPKAQKPRRDGRECYTTHLHPFHVPNLEILVLTDVPSHVPADSPILESLMEFITACSNEALLATLQAGSDYSLPPGQDRARAEQERAKSLFAMRRLVLEITPVTNSRPPLYPIAWKSVSSQLGHQKSSTGDSDLERLWSAASDDFSFFGDTECGIPEYAQERPFPMAALSETVTPTPHSDRSTPELAGSFPTSLPLRSKKGFPASASSQSRSNNRASTTEPPPIVDLVAELASFRRRKKSQYEQAVRDHYQRRSMNEALSPQPYYTAGSTSTLSPSPALRASIPASGFVASIAHHVEGHWKGEVKIVRNATPKGRTGMVDMYGNYFEKGYLYP
ncbi:hypothetical protein BJX63DRAFT_408229 [Aspergillus granulosus]|uniref:Uncharacterized protein n=1 Tax=Aspergillus granulosus TaxID=176169 RepID=A0ABR4H1F9_9EURO